MISQFHEIFDFILQEFPIFILVMLLSIPIQLGFCFKTERKRLKLVPVYIIIFISIIAGYAATESSIGALVISHYLGLLVAVPALIGVTVAWIIYGIYEISHCYR